MIPIFAFLFGSLVGSFLNVCIHRLPREESIVFPSSHCPACQVPIRPWDNIPFLSFLLLRGRCRACGTPIPWRYPLVEGLTAILFAATASRFGATPLAVTLLLFLSALMVIAFIDLDHQIIPNIITLPGIPLGLLASLVVGGPPLLIGSSAPSPALAFSISFCSMVGSYTVRTRWGRAT